MPRGEQIPVNPRLITWARERAGFTALEALSKFQNIGEWEAGNAYPTYPQLEALADEFRIPVAVFFFPEPPNLPPIRESFRTLPDVQFNQIPRPVLLHLRKGKAFQLNLMELCQGRNPAERLITRDLALPENVSVRDMVGLVREYLGISVAAQCQWGSPDLALKNWRQVLQSVGVFVFKDSFGMQEYCGFSLYDDVFPIIYVNNNCTKTRQIFTLFHELAHLLFHTSGIDVEGEQYVPSLPASQRRIEVLCNQFAAEFLVPEAAFLEAMTGRDYSQWTAENLADHFHVSREVIYRKFLDRSWIERDEYHRAARFWAAQRQSGGSGGNHYRTKLAYLGREYIGLALTKFYRNEISESQLGEYLDTAPKNLSNLEDYFSRGGQ